MKRYGMFPVSRCGVVLDEMQEAEDGEWVRWEDVQKAPDLVQQIADVLARFEASKPPRTMSAVATAVLALNHCLDTIDEFRALLEAARKEAA